MKIGFIGAGKMAEALIKSIISAEITGKNSIYASDISKERLSYIEQETGINTAANKEILDSDMIILAVKPQNMVEVLEELQDLNNKLTVTIAAGIKISLIEKYNARVIRVMPNTPCLVGEMAAAYSLGKNITKEDEEIVNKILNSAGKAFKVKEESLDAVTALSGSGPAFIAYLIKSMAEAAEKQGLDKDTALKLAEQTCLGTAKLLIEKNLGPEELIKIVSSPGGTTIAGREVLEKSDIKDIINKTIEAAAKRSKELGK